MAEQTGMEMQQAAHFAADGLSCIEPLIRRMDKTDVQQGRSERSGESYSLSYVEPLSDARTKLVDVFNILSWDQIGMARRLGHDARSAEEMAGYTYQLGGQSHADVRRRIYVQRELRAFWRLNKTG